ncbi:MAG: GntR family transcriptional regulator [Caldilineales bacterium]|nr:GntR family transcriptional regulator [Caldilineales bacterium]
MHANRSLSQEAYQTIRQKIIALDLPPGAVIDEARLQTDLGLGRTPIREALQRLALEKLVAIIPRRGTFVADIGITDLHRLFEARLVLETLAARLAAQRGSEAHWQTMAAALDRIPAADPVPPDLLIAIDEQCHAIMYEAADNKFLQDTLTTLYALSLRLWYYSLARMGGMREAILEHRHILAALRRRDADAAADLLETHIRTFQANIQSVVLGATAGNGNF